MVLPVLRILVQNPTSRRLTVLVNCLLAVGAILIGTGIYLHESNKAETFSNWLTAVSTGILLLSFAIRLSGRQQLSTEDYEDELSSLVGRLAREVGDEIAFSAGHAAAPLINTRYEHLAGPSKELYEDGTITTLRTRFERSRARRLVCVGPGGAGKTLLLRICQQQLLDLHGSFKIPIFARLSAWDLESDLETWLISELSRYTPQAVASRLLQQEEDRVVLLLDGLDEMNEPGSKDRAQRALEILDGSRLAMAITSRDTSDDETLLPLLRLADIVRMRPVTREEARNHLSASNVDSSIMTELVGEDVPEYQTAIAATLELPLFLQMAADAAIADHATELANLVKLPATPANVSEVEKALFVEFVRFVGRRPRPSWTRSTNKRYADDKLQKWCNTLAVHVREMEGKHIEGKVRTGRLIIPHQLWPIAGVEAIERGTRVLTVLLWLPLLVLVAWLYTVDALWDGTHITIYSIGVFCVTLALWINAGSVRPLKIVLRRLLTKQGWLRMAVAASVAISLYAFATIGSHGSFGVEFGCGFFVAFGLGLSLAVRPDVELPIVLLAGFVAGGALGFVAFSVVSRYGAAANVAAGTVAGAISLIVALAAGIRTWNALGRPYMEVPYFDAQDPFFRLRGDLETAVVLLVITAGIAYAVLRTTNLIPVAPVVGILLALAAGLAVGPGLISVTWRRYLLLKVLAFRRLPWRLSAFLKWGYEASVFRRSAAAYEFRHEGLREFLAEYPHPFLVVAS